MQTTPEKGGGSTKRWVGSKSGHDARPPLRCKTNVHAYDPKIMAKTIRILWKVKKEKVTS